MSIETTAYEIKRAFVRKMRLKFPYYDPKQEAPFYKAAEICEQLKANPSIYVEAQFDWLQTRGIKDIFANMMHHSQAIKAYEKYMEESYVPPEKLFETCKGYVERQVLYVGRNLESVLLDDNIDLPAWFRVVASAAPIPSVMQKYRERARNEVDVTLLEFLKDKGLDTKRY